MIWKRSILASLFAITLVVAGCDTGAPRTRGTTIVTPGAERELLACVLLGIQGDADQLCAGSQITLFGFNFPDDLSEVRVAFTAGDSTAVGMPLEVRNRRRDINSTTVESFLDVLVPSGVSTGIVELFCRDNSAGAAGFDSCPVIYSATLGANGDLPFLFYFPGVGFDLNGSRVTLYGLNLADAQEVLLDDGAGNTARVPASTFIRDPTVGQVLGQIPTGYESFAFEFNDTQNNIQFPFTDERENVGMIVRSPNGRSNRVEIPIANDRNAEAVGAVINGMRPPVGVSTGSVRIDYSCYEIVPDAGWEMDFEWCVSDCDNESGWFAAKPDDSAEISDGKFGIACGPIQQGLGGGDGRRLFPGGGAVRTFVWDAQCDPNFRAFNDEIVDGISAARDWTVHLRCTPILESGQRPFIDHVWEAPPFLYFDLEDRESESTAEQRRGQLVEDFEDDASEEFLSTTAKWGPPDNPGFLEGTIETTDLLQFGEGRARVILENQDLSDLPEQETIVGQFYGIDTTRVRITHNVLRNLGGLPGDPPTFVVDSSNYLLTDDGTEQGNRVLNPGEDVGELHVEYFEIRNDTEVFVEGPNPLVVRVSGPRDDPSDTEPNVVINGLLDANGLDGGDGADESLDPGAGGFGFAGGGTGGNGGMLQTWTPISGEIRVFVDAERGGNDGGYPGQTPASVDPDQTAAQSRVPGSGGGGGGHRARGASADLGRTSGFPSEYVLPRVGRGGPARGDFTQVPLTHGSGGGGGGAALSKVNSAQTGVQFVTTGGAGGGGGGGTIKFTVRGSILVEEGTIECNGGDGGSGLSPPRDLAPTGTERPGPGGGGSGGSVVLQATGSVRLSDCNSLQVEGGLPGTGGASGNQTAGAGSNGYVRIESALGGTPVCSALAAQSTLRSSLSGTASGTEIELVSGAAFPSTGVVEIEDELILYASKVGDTLLGLERGHAGTERESHSSGREVLYLGPILPRDDTAVLIDGGVVQSPDELDFGLGRDGILNLTFVPSVDPDTGGPLLDEGTGRPISVWTFDTDTSTLSAPTGEITLRGRHRNTQPGFLDLLSLVIAEDVVLRGVGSNPLDLSVRDRAEIAGTIDVSGFAGGALRFNQSGLVPLPGVGGAPGPGGGRGGRGGTVEFLDGDPENKAALNTNPIDGESGGLPLRQALLDSVNQNGQLGFLPSTPATAGASLHGQACSPNCVNSTGGGGGGGNLRAGGDGQALVQTPGLDVLAITGDGGSTVGFGDFRFGGEAFLVGGMGGAGGGGNPDESSSYRNGAILGDFPFPGTARVAPGTGGGGGGGILRIAVANFHLRRGARIRARGGDAYQSIDLGGNGGAGAGGNVLIQIANTLTVDDGVEIDVSGGKANRLARRRSDRRLIYEGNVRRSASGTEPSEEICGSCIFGGLGGDGSNGRVRLEAAAGSGLVSRGVNSAVSTGPLLRDVVMSVGISRPLAVGVSAGLAASSHSQHLGLPRVVFNSFQQPAGTSVVVLWEGAGNSRDLHSAPGAMEGLVRDPRELHNSRYVRFRAYFLSNFVNRQTQSVRSVGLPISIESGQCLPFGF